MKFTLVSALFTLALPIASALPTTPSTSDTSTSTTATTLAISSNQDTSISDVFDLAQLAERGADLFHALLSEKPEKKSKRSIAVREVAINLRDQLNSGDVDLNKALANSLQKLNATTTELDLNDMKTQGFQLLREGIEAQDFNKLAQKVFYAGTSKITRREAWSWAGFLNGPILRAGAKVGVSIASNLLNKVDLNAVARSGLAGLENMVGKVDMNKAAGQGAGLLNSVLGGVNVNSVVKTALGFLFP